MPTKEAGSTLPDTTATHKEQGPKSISFAAAIVSTTRFAEMQKGKLLTDQTFPVIENILKTHPDYVLKDRTVLPDDRPAIQKYLLEQIAAPNHVDVILLAGGTGISSKDQTVESCRTLFHKEITGFGELFRYLSFQQIGTAAMISRAAAGTIKSVLVFCLPGSPRAVQLALEKLILPEISHMCYEMHKE
ncbi:MAG: molybdenum cofactor synthesis domain-containing protein [Promethearchaeota archaeon CR_4]|nr:MAG: molybdenum cofactor synthesis domain-containing protein [Candidatus Lokiarchaeota archaeon CR_4]